MKRQTRLPLFPLGLVLLPTMKLPLHIFEERYRELVNTCIRENREFGIVYYNGSTLRKSGSSASIEQIIQTYDDGRIDILTQGRKRFHIDRLFEDKPYIEAEVTYYQDEPDLYNRPLDELVTEALDRIKKITELSGKSFSPEDFIGIPAKDLSFLLSATDVLSIEEKQENLESVSVRCRFERIITAAERHIERIESTQRIQKMLGEDDDISHMFN
ncbi:LON peptidase substrate-binding domain-containing protein [Spirochaeta lutea]|uniref:LON peptidase substrate-binding domain-containing protein n=1 Tax=Spirochaeta lutea TaxID=1480694 RepID=UPI00138DD321|nr:LON peptidase substrate-binding domain-containing protein [Spirochaeta lutea]